MTEEEIEIARIFSGNKYLQEYAVGYKKAKEDIIEKACAWLKEKMYIQDCFINNFRKKMEE